LAKQKGTTLAEALGKVANFIQATKICAEIGDQQGREKVKERGQTKVEKSQRN